MDKEVICALYCIVLDSTWLSHIYCVCICMYIYIHACDGGRGWWPSRVCLSRKPNKKGINTYIQCAFVGIYKEYIIMSRWNNQCIKGK